MLNLISFVSLPPKEHLQISSNFPHFLNHLPEVKSSVFPLAQSEDWGLEGLEGRGIS